jgi:hypothetical protein
MFPVAARDGEAFDLGLVGGAHLQPDLPRPKARDDAVLSLHDLADHGGRGQAGDDQVRRLGQHFRRVCPRCALREQSLGDGSIEVAHGQFETVALQAPREFLAYISETDKSDFHLCITLR